MRMGREQQRPSITRARRLGRTRFAALHLALAVGMLTPASGLGSHIPQPRRPLVLRWAEHLAGAIRMIGVGTDSVRVSRDSLELLVPSAWYDDDDGAICLEWLWHGRPDTTWILRRQAGLSPEVVGFALPQGGWLRFRDATPPSTALLIYGLAASRRDTSRLTGLTCVYRPIRPSTVVLFPNPARRQVEVLLDGPLARGPVTVAVCDVAGRLVEEVSPSWGARMPSTVH